MGLRVLGVSSVRLVVWGLGVQGFRVWGSFAKGSTRVALSPLKRLLVICGGTRGRKLEQVHSLGFCFNA